MRLQLYGLSLAVVLAGVAPVLQCAAQTSPPTRIRGAIGEVQGSVMTVQTREHQMADVILDGNLAVASVRKVALSSINPDTYVGIASRKTSSGSLEAIEVLVFPDNLRGTGEGQYPWDLEPGSMMTNATVGGIVQSRDGRDVTLNYKGWSQTIHVPASAPVVTLVPAAREDLKPGAPVFLSARPGDDGRLHAARVIVGKDGVAPPM